MTPGHETSLLTRYPEVVRHRINVTEYHRMGEIGILGPEDRVELIEGEVIVMAPIGSDHSGTINTLTRLLCLAVGARAIVAVQNPVRLDDHSEPQPDFALLRPRADVYYNSTPTPAEVFLAIEVAASSPAFDRDIKSVLYARRGIRELWIVDLAGGAIDVLRSPTPERYSRTLRLRRGDMLEMEALPGVSIPVSAVLR